MKKLKFVTLEAARIQLYLNLRIYNFHFVFHFVVHVHPRKKQREREKERVGSSLNFCDTIQMAAVICNSTVPGPRGLKFKLSRLRPVITSFLERHAD